MATTDMKIKQMLQRLLFSAISILGCHAQMEAAEVLFSDSFSGDLSAWTGKFCESHQGQIVSDPLVAGIQS